MQLVHAIFERGVFRPTGFVNLPDGCEVEFEPHLTVSRDRTAASSVASRVNELRSLENGWLNGKGLAPTGVGLDWLVQSFEAKYSDELPQPYVYPTAEGGVQLEWSVGGCEASLEIDLATHQAQWHRLNLKTSADSFHEINMDDTGDWTTLIEEIRQLAGSES